MPTTNTWPLDSPMLPPLVLRPPHGPRLVRLLVMVLAVIFYVPPAGWSLITNGPEGELAGAALELLNRQGWMASGDVALLHGPLALWLTRSSLAFFGVNELAARLPAALAVVALLWFTLRLAERSATLWNGCVAALLLLGTPGMLTLGRLLTPLPLAAALVAACVYSLQRSVQDRPERSRWLMLAWLAWGAATLAGGWLAGAIPAGIIIILAGFYPEARLRFKGLLSWPGGLVVVLTTGLMIATGFPPWSHPGVPPQEPTPWGMLFWGNAVLLFPWSMMLLPPLVETMGRLTRLRRLEWEEALPLAWLAAAAAAALVSRTFFALLLCWPALAVWGADRLNTLHRKAFLNLCATVAAGGGCGLYLTQHLRTLLPVLFPAKEQTLSAVAPFLWYAVTPVAFLAVLAFVLLAVAAFGAELVQNRRFALLALCAAMIPAGFALADIGAKFAPYFSDAPLAGCIESERHPVYLDASPTETSSLLFYLGEEGRRRLQPVPPDLPAQWHAPALLVTSRPRVSSWKQSLGGRFTAGCESGEHVLLVAAP